MATQSLLYGTLTAFTLTGASLGSYAAREGTQVSNSTNLYIDMILSGTVTLGAAASTGDLHILLSYSDGTNISTPATGLDAAITIPDISNLGGLQLGQIVPGTELIYFQRLQARGSAAGAVIKYGGLYVAQAFGGNIPIGGWAPVLVNCTGQALSASATVTDYVGLKYTIA